MTKILVDVSKVAWAFMLMLLIATFILRLTNIWFGYPLPVHPDEPVLVNTALNISVTGDLNPYKIK
jgi:hypothetical protein